MATVVYLLALLAPFVAAHNDGRQAILQLLMKPEGTCVGSGYISGCCVGNNCASLDKSCYCDQICHRNNDCCDDIEMIGCSQLPTTSKPTSTTTTVFMATTPSCAAANHTNGCCMDGHSRCRVGGRGEYCYCDQWCYEDGNCCRDIKTAAKCYPRGCSDAGHRSCCESSNCTVQTSGNTTCYCDALCSLRRDCCSDAMTLCARDVRFEQLLAWIMKSERMAKVFVEAQGRVYNERLYRALLARIMDFRGFTDN